VTRYTIRYAGLTAWGVGAPVKDFTSLLIPFCPPDTLWHWGLRAWQYLCTVSATPAAQEPGGVKKKSKFLTLVPSSFQDIDDWRYNGATALATRAIAMGLQNEDCSRCADVPTHYVG
jgi:hypothetical protein